MTTIRPRANTGRELTKAEQRRKVLADIDNAVFTQFHVRAAGAGFFTDAYDTFAINLCIPMLGIVYGHLHPGGANIHNGQLSKQQELALKIAAPVGNLVGMVAFGWLADVFGRKKMYGIELILMVTATFGQAIAGGGPGVNIIGVLITWRFFMGVGIGGDYPLSAVITSEFATTRFRGRMMAAVVAMQGFGNITASLVALIVTAAFKDAIVNTDPLKVDYLWRLVIGLGMIPGVLALYSRLTIPETPRFTMDVERNLDQAASDAEFVKDGKFDRIDDRPIQRVDVPKASRRDFMNYYSKWSNLKVLLGCSWSWFALDFAFYGLGLNPDIIFHTIGFVVDVNQTTPYTRVFNTAVGNIILAIAGLIPGYWVSFALIDHWGRRPIQLMGFIVLTVIFLIMGFGYNRITSKNQAAFAFLYALANFFQNFGPNCTTFVLPGELFPTRYRTTSHGISAASGKLGAILAQVLLLYAKDIGGSNKSIDHILEILALFMITGVFSTLLIPETKGRTLESLSGEEEEGGDFTNEQMLQSTTVYDRLRSMKNLFRRRPPPSSNGWEGLY
ncbi:Inorganic phosphate transporter pho84 [Tulasnella sp. 403]|nr:Inorganic phosphate transporter pho84 [Tulasnella sp. 403]